MKPSYRKCILVGLVVLTSLLASALAGVTSVIVELEQAPAAVWAAQQRAGGSEPTAEEIEAYRAQLSTAQDDFLQALSSQGVAYQVGSYSVTDAEGAPVNVEFRYTLVYNGVNLLLEQSAVPTVEAMAGVEAVHPDSVFQPQLDNSVRYIRADELYGGVAELTPFDDLREGFEGQGIFISVIDTGIEWQHEMFGGDPTPPRLGVEPSVAAVNRNQKIIYYLPLADLAVEDGYGHGTHVASTAAGYLGFAPGRDGLPLTEDDVPVHGVAPQAKLLSYSVCSDVLSTVGSLTGTVGGCLTSAIVMGIEDSVSPRTVNGFAKPVAHVINMSLGGAGTPDSPTAVASDNASLLGTVVVSSAGNSGPGQATVGAPAAGRHVIAVGASTDPGGGDAWSTDVLDSSTVAAGSTGSVVPADQLPLAAGERDNIKIFPMAGTPAPPDGAMAQYYVYVDGAQLLANWPATVNGRIALARAASPATFAQIVANATASGAEAVLNISSTESPTAVRGAIPGANIKPADAEYLLGLISGTPGVNPPSGAISSLPIRLKPRFGSTFEGSMAGFSSRGPVAGLGQVKPDVAAPGVNVLAAMPPASLLGALSGGNYGAISGTSMASPHVAGAAALVKQTNPGWSPAMVRTALINTATNLRDEQGTPKADGTDIESIIDQGGGLIDAYAAANARALLGVAGDGIAAPSILGSHSFGQVPVIDSRVTHSETVTVHLVDVSGVGGSYDLSIANNRGLEMAGISASAGSGSVSVDPYGSASFTVSATVDGDVVREGPVQVQFYLVADRSDGQQTLRMPFFLQAVESVPLVSGSSTETFTGTVLVGDSNSFLVPGVSFDDVPVTVGADTLRLEASLTFPEIVDDTVADLDFYLLDPSGAQIAASTNPGGPEFIGIDVSAPGVYTYRVSGWLNGPTDYEILSTQITGGGPPALQAFDGDFVDSQGNVVDFDGDFTVRWTGNGSEAFFEVEQSVDGGAWTLIATLDGATNSLDLEDQPRGVHSFRVRALVAGQIGYYASEASDVESVTVDQRVLERITRKVATSISNVSFVDGVFSLDLAMTNQDDEDYVPLVELNVVKIQSASGTVEAINADNGGSGVNRPNRALYDYSYQLGGDDRFSAGETSGVRTLQFSDPAAELFTFKVCVTAYRQVGAGAGSESGAGGSGGEGSSAPESGDDSILDEMTAVLEFTADPLTGTVLVSLVEIL